MYFSPQPTDFVSQQLLKLEPLPDIITATTPIFDLSATTVIVSPRGGGGGGKLGSSSNRRIRSCDDDKTAAAAGEAELHSTSNNHNINNNNSLVDLEKLADLMTEEKIKPEILDTYNLDNWESCSSSSGSGSSHFEFHTKDVCLTDFGVSEDMIVEPWSKIL